MVSKAQRARELAEFEGEEAFHRREWLFQRVAWTLLALFIAAGLAGVFGSGPLSAQILVAEGGTLEIDRFVRRRASKEWKIRPSQKAAHGSHYEVRVSASFLEGYEISTIVPEPTSMVASGGDVKFIFDASAASGPIVFHAEPERIGFSTGTFVLSGSEPVRVRQFIYP
jgi:hypothetical protein